MKTKLLAIITSMLICITTGVFGFVASRNPAYRSGWPPALYINEVDAGWSGVLWKYPDGRYNSIHGDGPPAFYSEFTVAPSAVLKLHNEPFWFGTRSATFKYYELLPTDDNVQPFKIADPVPVRYTAFGNPIAPENPGRYVASIEVVYDSYIPDITGSGSLHTMISFTVE